MINYENLPEFPGFTVYDRETGEPVNQTDIKLSNGKTLFDIEDKFCLYCGAVMRGEEL